MSADTATTTGGLAGTVRSWLRSERARSVELELDGDTLDVSGLSSKDQRRVIDAWLSRHAQEAEDAKVGKPEPQDQVPESVEAGSVGEAIEEEGGEGPGLAGYRDHEHQAHPEGVGGADLGHLHEAIEEEGGEGPGLAGYRDHEHQAHPEGVGGADLGHVLDRLATDQGVAIEQAVRSGDDYASRLLKYIPTETVAAYLALSGVVASANDQNRAAMLWIVFAFGLLLTPLYLRRVGNVRSWLQLGISTAAFGVWVFALGGPWALLSWYEPYQGTLLLIAFTTTAPLVIPVPPSLHTAPASG